MTVLITGGAGFIVSAVKEKPIRLINSYTNCKV